MRAQVTVLSVIRELHTIAIVQLLPSNAVLKCHVRNCEGNLQQGKRATLCVCAYTPPVLQVDLELPVDFEQTSEGSSSQSSAQESLAVTGSSSSNRGPNLLRQLAPTFGTPLEHKRKRQCFSVIGP
jgi:hypothetical protein